jgi:prolyl oligopeptidase
MKTPLRASLPMFLLTLTTLAQSTSLSSPPASPKRPVTDQYHGVRVEDDYRWLEDWNDAEVKQWSTAQNIHAREYLDKIAARSAIKGRIRELVQSSSANYYSLQFRGKTLFAMKYQPPRQQPMIVALNSAADPSSEKVIFDPNVTSKSGSLAIDFFVPSHDGKFVAAALSESGSEDSSGHVFEVATGRELSDSVPRVNFATAGGSLEWKADNSGFYYTRYPQGNERPTSEANFYQQVYFHRLGTDSLHDVYLIGKDFPRIAEIQLQSSEDGRWLVATVANGDGGEFSHFLMNPAGHWTQITHFDDGIVTVKVSPKGGLYMLSRRNAPRGLVLFLSSSQTELAHAKVLVPQSPGTGLEETAHVAIQSFAMSAERLYVTDIVGGPSRVRVFDLQGRPSRSPSLPPISAVYETVSIGGGNVLIRSGTYLQPPAWYQFNSADGKLTRTALSRTTLYTFEDAEVVREFAISRDGTRVPLNIIQRRGTHHDGSSPVLLTGYGGYGISVEPSFAGSFARTWLDHGGVYVTTNLRGGGEYGEEWHKSGSLTHKQNVFDDFIACAQFLIANKYTSPEHLAILGASNGGLLMGAAFTQHPELFRAAVSYVGIYDMLRNELDPNGAFNTTEYGSVLNDEQFKSIYAYSPYHHVKDGVSYPAVLFLTGENDHRVNPLNSRKMTARMQTASSSGYPILLRTSSTSGHGVGSALDEQIEETTDVLCFLSDQLSIDWASLAK